MELDALMERVDFVSVGSNDLLQFLFAADRSNPLVASRYDPLSVASLRALRRIAGGGGQAQGAGYAVRGNGRRSVGGDGVDRSRVPLHIDGAGCDRSGEDDDPFVGQQRVHGFIEERLEPDGVGNLRDDLRRFAELNSIEI